MSATFFVEIVPFSSEWESAPIVIFLVLGAALVGVSVALGIAKTRHKRTEQRLAATAATLRQRYGSHAQSRSALLQDTDFADTAAGLAGDVSLSQDDLVRLANRDDRWVSCIALGALADRSPQGAGAKVDTLWPAQLIRRVDSSSPDLAGLLIGALASAPGDVIGAALSKADAIPARDIVDLLQARVSAGLETFDVGRMRTNVARKLSGEIASLLEEHRAELPGDLIDAFEQWLAENTMDAYPNGRVPWPEMRARKPEPLPYLELLLQSAKVLDDRYDHSAASRSALYEDPVFVELLDELNMAHAHAGVEAVDLLELARDNRLWVSRLALAILHRCEDVPAEWVPQAIRRMQGAPWDHAGLLALSLRSAPGEVIGPVLAMGHEVMSLDMVELIAERVEGGYESLAFEQLRGVVPASTRPVVVVLLEEHGASLPDEVRLAFEQWVAGQIDLDPEIAGLVTVWERPFVHEPVLLNRQRSLVAHEIVETVTQAVGKSVILIGESGVGKTALVRAAFEPTTWSVFEAQASQLNAGAMYVGQLEGRVEELARRLESQRAIWVFPNFQAALFTGAHSTNPTGLIDRLLPYVQRGSVRIVAETTPSDYASMIARLPVIASAFVPLRISELTEEETVPLCRDILGALQMTVDSDGTLRELHGLAQQFLPGHAAPGNTLRLLRSSADSVRETGRDDLAIADVYTALSLACGIPLAVLDPSQALGLERIRGFFEERVLGQSEAIGVLVDRIALVKAGLTDPTRPLGVFLFVGPTGTGKTELAKALAELVFGSATRMARLDMSEYQTPDSLDRLLADANIEPAAAPLIATVRRSPFSVVLLDEFEKAAPPVRDLFLQLFDDGRLTDRSGRTTDFRRCLVIMTSNVGSALQTGPGLGFSEDVEPFRRSGVNRALRATFRPEFLNRIDRIVVFRPFDRSEMRALLEKELDDVVLRRGMRDRPWSIEFDESAIDFLIEKGFTPDLGARPLKRAVEEYVLTPLARVIADARVPTGDQFLFLSASDDRIDIRFVGLDAEHPSQRPAKAVGVEQSDEQTPPGSAPEGELRTILRTGVRSQEARSRLRQVTDAVSARIDGLPALRKHLLLTEMTKDDFWDRDDRFVVLAEIEYLDRLEEATRTARHLADRLQQSTDPRVRDEVGVLLANRLFVLEHAVDGLDHGAPFEVAMRLSLTSGTSGREGEAFTFLEQIRDMYDAWAIRCGMTIKELQRTPRDALLAVSGLGAGDILAREAGLHVAEIVEQDDGEAGVDRIAVLVEVAGVPIGEPVGERELVTRVMSAIDATSGPSRLTRRYQFRPTPLVRDAVRGYRTGRIDRVLAGDFDLYEA